MVQVYADGSLIYDNRLPETYGLLALKASVKLNAAGSATIEMPPGHPAYSAFVSLRTIVEIWKNSEMIFRGRALYPSDDIYKQRVITCESERCFLGDAVMRPYLYQDSPENIFRAVLAEYNAQVDTDKQFAVGTVTVTDDNDYIRVESSNASSVADMINKLVDRCGGYITFSTAQDGRRAVNWLASLSAYSAQSIEFGENMLDFAREDYNADLATVLIPYGAQDEETGERVTIRTVNDGEDYIQDNEAVALRGKIVKTATWDDVTVPANLLRKAQQYLAAQKMVSTTIKLSAVDLSDMDSSIDSFSVGDLIRVRSVPHGIDKDFLLTERSYDFLSPGRDTVTLGADTTSLTGSQASEDRKNAESIGKVERTEKSDYQKNKELISGTETRLASLIKQTSDSIESEVSKQQQSLDDLTETVTTLRQTAESLSATVRTIEEDGVNRVTTITGTTLDKDGLHVTKDGEEMESRIDYSGLHVERNGAAILEATASGVEAENVTVRTYLTIGLHARFEDYSNDRDSARTACFFV